MMIVLPQGQLWTTSKGTSSIKWCSYVHRFNFNQYLWFFLLFYLLIFVFVYPSIPSILICWMAPLTCSTCLCYYGSCMSKCLCALGASILACLHALRANVPADLGTLHVYVPTCLCSKVFCVPACLAFPLILQNSLAFCVYKHV